MFNDRVTILKQEVLDKGIYRMTLQAPEIAQTADKKLLVKSYVNLQGHRLRDTMQESACWRFGSLCLCWHLLISLDPT